MQNLLAICRRIAEIWRFFDFFKWRPYFILDLLCACLDHSRKVFGGVYHGAKFGRNRCSSCDPQKAPHCTETHHMTYRSLRSLYPVFAQLTRLRKPPKSYALQCICIPISLSTPKYISIGSYAFAGLMIVTDRPTDHATAHV